MLFLPEPKRMQIISFPLFFGICKNVSQLFERLMAHYCRSYLLGSQIVARVLHTAGISNVQSVLPEDK